MGKNKQHEDIMNNIQKLWENKEERNASRIPEVIDKLKELWLLYPDLRFGQLYNMIEYHTGKKHCSFYIEEDLWLETIMKLIDERKKRN